MSKILRATIEAFESQAQYKTLQSYCECEIFKHQCERPLPKNRVEIELEYGITPCSYAMTIIALLQELKERRTKDLINKITE